VGVGALSVGLRRVRDVVFKIREECVEFWVDESYML